MALTQLERLLRVFDVLAGLSDQVVLQKNTAKMVGVVYHPCHASGGLSGAAYERRITGKGPKFWESLWMRLKCPECGVEVTAGSLLTHHHIQNGMG